jgi:hypothetical protein
MKIISITGVVRSNEIAVTKSIGSLIIGTSLELSGLTTEKISAYIERANGSNVILANKVPLLDFILASTYGNEAVQSDENYKTIALCEMALDGGVYLAEKEKIIFLLEDLQADETYDLNGVEEPSSSNLLYFFEQKTIASEDFNKKIDVEGYDLAIMTRKDSLQDIAYGFENGQTVKYTPFELQTLSSNVDPITAVNSTGVVLQRIPQRLSLPLVHVNTIEVNKSQGEIINFVVRNIRQV